MDAAVAPQKEQEHHDGRRPGELSEAVGRPSTEELAVGRELVRSAQDRGAALTGLDGIISHRPDAFERAEWIAARRLSSGEERRREAGAEQDVCDQPDA